MNPAGNDGVGLLAHGRAQPIGEALNVLRRRAAQRGGELACAAGELRATAFALVLAAERIAASAAVRK